MTAALHGADLLVAGGWPREAVTATWVPSTLELTAADEAAIAARWAQRQAAGAGISLFDGPMGRLETWQADAAGLRLTLSRTSYRVFLGTNVDHPGHPRARRADCRPRPSGRHRWRRPPRSGCRTLEQHARPDRANCFTCSLRLRPAALQPPRQCGTSLRASGSAPELASWELAPARGLRPAT